LLQCFCFFQWVEFLAERFVVTEWRNGRRKEFPSLPHFLHLLYDLRDQLLIFFFGILSVEDTIFFVFESCATETVMTVMTEMAVENIATRSSTRKAK